MARSGTDGVYTYHPKAIERLEECMDDAEQPKDEAVAQELADAQ
jgi:hypothetical protein